MPTCLPLFLGRLCVACCEKTSRHKTSTELHFQNHGHSPGSIASVNSPGSIASVIHVGGINVVGLIPAMTMNMTPKFHNLQKLQSLFYGSSICEIPNEVQVHNVHTCIYNTCKKYIILYIYSKIVQQSLHWEKHMEGRQINLLCPSGKATLALPLGLHRQS